MRVRKKLICTTQRNYFILYHVFNTNVAIILFCYVEHYYKLFGSQEINVYKMITTVRSNYHEQQKLM